MAPGVKLLLTKPDDPSLISETKTRVEGEDRFHTQAGWRGHVRTNTKCKKKNHLKKATVKVFEYFQQRNNV